MREERERLTKCFAAVFPTLSADEIAAATPETVDAWDSIANVTLLVVVEQEFGIAVAPEDFEQLTSFAALLDYVTTKTGQAPQPRAA
jgi:acyl carrier protein